MSKVDRLWGTPIRSRDTCLIVTVMQAYTLNIINLEHIQTSWLDVTKVADSKLYVIGAADRHEEDIRYSGTRRYASRQ